MEAIRVFLADDHEVILDSLALMISTLDGITVVGTATTGREALVKIASLDVDIVLSDMDMPELNGIELAQLLSQQQPHIKLILLTMFEDAEVIQSAIEADIWGYVLKKARKNELENAIHTVAAGEKYFMAVDQPVVVDAYSEQLIQPLINVLSNREKEIIRLIVNEVPGAEIADQLFISPKTVETHRRNIFRKLDIHSVVALTRFAVKHKLI